MALVLVGTTFCVGATALWTSDHRDFYRSCHTCDYLNCLPIGWDCCPVVSEASRDLFGCDDTGRPDVQPMEASCDVYYVGTTCEWTQTYACPGTPQAELPGALVASDDGSLGYHCCCLHSAPPSCAHATLVAGRVQQSQPHVRGRAIVLGGSWHPHPEDS